jgi:single-strand DNA-binding protein
MIITTIAGGVGKDAVFKSTQQGQELCSFSVGASIGYGDKKQTIWFDVTKWGKGTDKLAGMLLKGTKVTVSGELSTREYEGKTYLQLRADHVALQGSRQGGDQQRDEPKQDEGFAGGSDDLDDDLDSVPF